MQKIVLGNGDVIVGVVASVLSGKGTGVAIITNGGSGPIGELAEDVAGGDSEDYAGVTLEFTAVAALDILVGALQKIRQDVEVREQAALTFKKDT